APRSGGHRVKNSCEKGRSGGSKPRARPEELTAISQEGEGVLLGWMRERGKFRCGVFTKHVLRQVARRIQENRKEAKIKPATSSLRARTGVMQFETWRI